MHFINLLSTCSFLRKGLILLVLPVFVLLFSFRTVESDKLTVPPFWKTPSPWADSVFASLSPQERIAQLFMVAAYSDKDESHYVAIDKLVSENKIGGLIFFKGTPSKQAELTNRYQFKAKTPLMIAMDAEWGLSMRLDSTVEYPRQMMLGAIQNEKLVYEMGRQIAEQCRRMGVHVNFAPVIDVNNNAKNPVINNRAFGEVRENVARLGLAYMKGLQDERVLACGKHFPGHGDTDADSHLSLPVIGHARARLDSVELFPFRQLIAEGLGSMMVAHLFIPSLDSTKNAASTLSKAIVTDLLQKELGFEGLIFTDALNMKGVADFYAPGEVDLKALLAGNDVLLFAQDVPTALNKINAAVASGLISQAEIDRRCLKILRAKEWCKVHQSGTISIENLFADLNRVEYEALNNRLAKESITLIKNAGVLPLPDGDTMTTVYLNVGHTEQNPFYDALLLYRQIDQIQIPRALSAEEESALLDKCYQYDRIIIGYHRTNNTPKRNFGVTIQSIQIQEKLAKSRQVIGVLFGNPYALESFGEMSTTSAFIVAYQDIAPANSAAAQLIFGGISPKGKLPVSGSLFFPVGTGITNLPVTRLSHALPEEMKFSSEKLSRIDSICEKSIQMRAFPGCQVVAVKDGAVIYNKSFGFHTYEKKQKVRNSDLYDLASITKIAATTLSLIKLQQEGKLDIDNKLTDYIPEIVDSTPYEKMVLRRMLAHQAGLEAWIPFYTKTVKDSIPDPTIYSADSAAGLERVAAGLYISALYDDTVILSTITKTALRSKTYKYSDIGYYFHKAIIEKITGQSLEQYVAENFYLPMGLRTMTYHPLYKFRRDQITPTELDKYFRNQLVWGDVHDMGAAMQGGVGGHAGLFSNALDLATLMYMLINDGNYGGRSYLNNDTLADFTREQGYPDNRRGAGFDRPVNGDGGPTCNKVSMSSFGHTGFTGTQCWADPDKGIIYVFLSNRCHPDAENWLIKTESIRTKIQDVIYSAEE